MGGSAEISGLDEINCTPLSEATVWPDAGPPAVVAHGGGFIVAAYAPEDEGETLFVARVAAGEGAVPIARTAVEPPLRGTRWAGPGLLSVDGRVWVARVDGAGHLGVAWVEPGRPGTPLRFDEVGKGADARFRPALARFSDAMALAWVDGTGTPMRAKVTRLSPSGRRLATHDVTLESMGGAAPVFAAGSDPPVLVLLDPRSGMSPVVRVPMKADGSPRTGEVVLTVGQAASPPDLAAAAHPEGIAVGYTAVGSGATTAVGLVELQAPTRAATALVKGTGYGRLAVAATTLEGGSLFVAEAPTARGRDAPRTLHVRVVRDGEPGPPLEVGAGHATAVHPAVARIGNTVAVAYATRDDVRVAFLRCG
ncbi:MAG: hypothetical protein ACODAU_12090 [Myxococcota bacterium]